MTRQYLFLQSVGTALFIGTVLALYISLTTFWRMSHGWWLGFHNLLVVISLVLAGTVGYKHLVSEVSFRFMFLSITVFFSVMMLLYIGSYLVTTAFFSDQMVWIPFFYHDYNYHGFTSVTAYLNHRNNFRELLELQIFSLLICSILYFAAGIVGYGAKAVIDRKMKMFG
jgi:hypothetical protein